jgi:hypothetical protein
VKSITIWLPDVETVMLVKVQKSNKACRVFQGFLVSQIQREYQKTPKGTALKLKLTCPRIPNAQLTPPTSEASFVIECA